MKTEAAAQEAEGQEADHAAAKAGEKGVAKIVDAAEEALVTKEPTKSQNAYG